MNIAHDASGKVWLTGSGPFPTELNGIKLTTVELTARQKMAYAALPDDRAGTVFDGGFSAIAKPVEQPKKREPTVADILSALKAKGILTDEDVIEK